MQLLISQRANGELTVGDTHAYDEPFDFAAVEEAYDHLHERAASILGRALPPVVRRWTGVYSQALDGAICHRRQVQLGVWVVTGPGGRGMTLSPAIAEQTIAEIGSPHDGPVTADGRAHPAGRARHGRHDGARRRRRRVVVPAGAREGRHPPRRPGHARSARVRAGHDGPVEDRGLPRPARRRGPGPAGHPRLRGRHRRDGAGRRGVRPARRRGHLRDAASAPA